MNILADRNIPVVKEAFEGVGRVRCTDGRRITGKDVRDIDILLVRSVTTVNGDLLGASRVQFVGSATAGTDHIDHAYVSKHDIKFAHAPGANAESVAEYVCAALVFLANQQKRRLRGLSLAVVGCGHVGSLLISKAQALGVEIMPCDPPLADQGTAPPENFAWCPWEDVLSEADVISLHVPLTTEGPHATRYLIAEQELMRMKPTSWLINTSRGKVVDSKALRKHIERTREGAVGLDVWENEPTPDPRLVGLVNVATPHIAGYSFDGKVQGTYMLYREVMNWLGRKPTWSPAELLGEERLQLEIPPASLPIDEQVQALIRQMYDISLDDGNLRRVMRLPTAERARAFSELRKNYRRRRSFAAYDLPEKDFSDELRSAFRRLVG